MTAASGRGWSGFVAVDVGGQHDEAQGKAAAAQSEIEAGAEPGADLGRGADGDYGTDGEHRVGYAASEAGAGVGDGGVAPFDFDDDGVGVIGIYDDVGPEAGVVTDYAGALGDDGAGVVAPLAALAGQGAGQGVVEGVFVH